MEHLMFKLLYVVKNKKKHKEMIMLLTKVKKIFIKSLLLLGLCPGFSSLYAIQATGVPHDDPTKYSKLFCTTAPNWPKRHNLYLADPQGNSNHNEVVIGAGGPHDPWAGVNNAFAPLATKCNWS